MSGRAGGRSLVTGGTLGLCFECYKAQVTPGSALTKAHFSRVLVGDVDRPPGRLAEGRRRPDLAAVPVPRVCDVVVVSVARGFGSRIRKNPGGVVVQVQRASDPAAAQAALEQARKEIANLDGGWQSAPGLSPDDRNGPTYVGAVVAAPSGPFLVIDGGHTPTALLETIPAIVARSLEESGVSDALVAWPDDDWPDGNWMHDFLTGWPRSAVLRLYPPPPPLVPYPQRQRYAALPADWFDEVGTWVEAQPGGNATVVGIAGPVGFPLSPGDAAGHLVRSRRAGSALIVAGDVEARARAAHATYIGHPTLALGGGGPAATDDDLMATVESLVTIARRLAPSVSYAHISIEQTRNALSPNFVSPDLLKGWYEGGRFESGPHPEHVQQLADEIVLDGFPYQILSEGHLRRLGHNLGRHDPSVEISSLPGGRTELSIGELSSWLPDRLERPGVQAAARKLLAPCLLATATDARELVAAKRSSNAVEGAP